ncbi:MAG: LysE family translocator [Actinomycetota bacterium]
MSTLLPFVAASFVLLVVPGPAVLYILARSSAQGIRAGLVSMVGVHVASIVHVVAAVVGLSAIVVASATAFSVVRWVGGGYLIYLGTKTILTARRSVAAGTSGVTLRPDRQLFTESFIVNLLNPKVALFFLAFLPQFASQERGPVWFQLLVLGVVYVLLGVVTDGVYAIVGGTIGHRVLTATRARSSVPKLVEGGVLVSLGFLTLAVPQRRTSPSA